MSRKVLNAEMKDATRQGLEVKNKKPEREQITDAEEEVLWEKGLLGSSTSEVILNTVYYYNGKLFGIRAKEHRDLRFQNIRVDNNYIIYDETVSKTYHGGLNQLKYQPRVSKHFCHEANTMHSRCLVNIYKLYLSLIEKFADKFEAFYFRPKRNPKVLGFDKAVVGINSLNKILPEKLCQAAGLPRKTAHCLRVTCASNLFQRGVEEKLIRERTGHKSNALLRYERPDETQLKKASAALAPATSSIREDFPSFDINVLSDIETDSSSVSDNILSDLFLLENESTFISDDILSDIFVPEDDQSFVNDDILSSILVSGNRGGERGSSTLFNPIFNNCTFNISK